MKDVKKIKLGIVISKFNTEITQGLYDQAILAIKTKGLLMDNIQTAWVPGAIEIPLITQRFAQQTGEHKLDAVICLGAVIRGETTHYDYVCQQVSYGCQRIALDCNIPVIFGVLTTENEKQAEARINKGAEAVEAALEMVELAAPVLSFRGEVRGIQN